MRVGLRFIRRLLSRRNTQGQWIELADGSFLSSPPSIQYSRIQEITPPAGIKFKLTDRRSARHHQLFSYMVAGKGGWPSGVACSNFTALGLVRLGAGIGSFDACQRNPRSWF